MYKVLQRGPNSLMSYGHHAAAQKYSESEENFPRIEGSKLFVFKELSDALNMVGVMREHIEIWECEVENPEICKSICFWMSPFQAFETFWNEERFASLLFLDIVPEGTWLVDSLRLLKPVER